VTRRQIDRPLLALFHVDKRSVPRAAMSPELYAYCVGINANPARPRSTPNKRRYNKQRRERNAAAGECINQTKARTHERPRPGFKRCDACRDVAHPAVP
jgi:hypothetical protein